MTRVRCLRISYRLHRDCEDVAGAAFGSDIERLRRIAFDLAAQAADLPVDGAIEDVVQPGKVEQLIASENAFRERPATPRGD